MGGVFKNALRDSVKVRESWEKKRNQREILYNPFGKNATRNCQEEVAEAR